ncbi:putative toxin-antitoxin system toxin component, PIN family [Alicyclobacillus vulcanalis]|uniref:Putative toxin-antitoxin system toxin component, PIN family n=1 Tax=Alicyclobacillus vulcanalis TaxID=252246 RepID=A0A1N7PR82_9BACL|nr:putative toxin-antitoxin system toxin component, PIN family [Alicyclobacillus vulcanalis]SIT12959.1 putative toxin-antitoxin system toxin component, PIN family [Alicyclobacillus vulcanalis]
MRVVLDTNVLISGLLLPHSVPGRIVQAWRSAQYALVISESMLDELERVLSYPKIQRRLQWSPGEIRRFVSLFRYYSDVVVVDESLCVELKNSLRDDMDVHVLATCIAGKANWLVSGDEDLLTVRDRYPVRSPAEFVAMLSP